jgi:hypothetical protein
MTATFYNTQQAIQDQQQDMPCVEFSAMGFDSFVSQDASVSTASTTSTTASSNLTSGWGSTISRRSYACLKTLGETEASKMHRPSRQIPKQSTSLDDGQTWGYFVDTPDE